MADSRRRSSRRGKKLELYSANDLVQIPHNSTTIIGRLSRVLIEQPSVRWLVTFDDIPNRKDEEIPEEALGPVVGHFENVPKIVSDSTIGGDNVSIVTPCTDDSAPLAMLNNDSMATRSSQRRKSSSSSSTDEGGTKTSGNKRKGRSSPPAVPKEVEDSTLGSAQDIVSLSPKITGRERRSRRRRGLSIDEVSDPTAPSATTTTTTTTTITMITTTTTGATASTTTSAKVASIATVGLSSPDRRPSAHTITTSKQKNDDTPKKKKAKITSPDRQRDNNSEVLKVPFLTGTLYLYRGARRHAEFIRKC